MTARLYFKNGIYLKIKTSPTPFIHLLNAYYVSYTLPGAEDTENE